MQEYKLNVGYTRYELVSLVAASLHHYMCSLVSGLQKGLRLRVKMK